MQPPLTTPTTHHTLVDRLVEDGLLNAKDALRAPQLLQKENGNLPRLLMKLGWVSEQDMVSTLSRHCKYPVASDDDYPTEPLSQLPISLRFMQSHQLIPAENNEGEKFVIMSDPSDKEALNALSFVYGALPNIKVGMPSMIDHAIGRIYGDEHHHNADEAEWGAANSEEDIERLKDLASETPIIQLVNKVIQKAVEVSASDIHIEPFESLLKVRYRVDGVLFEEEPQSTQASAAIISRIKIMASLDIAERRLPQDGRMMVRSHGKTVDMRVSTLPTAHGESVVMRILDRDSLDLDFKKLGFNDTVLPSFLKVLALPHGIILVTGPTGSGKSTTLYTAIKQLNSPSRKIITVEDPIEYQLEGINQLAVKPSIGLDFATALRSIVRQDPDIIMIGEMRDAETAKIAIQSALTGHLVLSTLHTNSAAAGITRLLDIGIESYLLVSTINGILGQRLVRKLCAHCKERARPSPDEAVVLKGIINDDTRIYRPKGCKACGHTGYHGRSIITEWLPLTESLQSLIMAGADAAKIQAIAKDEGMITLFQDGLQKVLAGETAIQEVLRVSQQH